MSLGANLRPLLQPARPAVICRHLGQLALILAVLLAVPTLFAYGSGDWPLAHRLLLAALLPALALGACALIPSPGRPVQANEALVVCALAFVLAPRPSRPTPHRGGPPGPGCLVRGGLRGHHHRLESGAGP